MNVKDFLLKLKSEGYRDVGHGNRIADKMSGNKTELATTEILKGIGFPIAFIRLSIIHSFYVEVQLRWQQQDTCRTPLDRKWTTSLLFFNMMAKHRTIARIVRHCSFSRNVERLSACSF